VGVDAPRSPKSDDSPNYDLLLVVPCLVADNLFEEDWPILIAQLPA
jgi:hypothetical protein